MTWDNILGRCINSSPNDIILDWSKFKAFADDKINLNEKFKFVFGRIENMVGKRDNAGYQHFLIFPQCFSKGCSVELLKVLIVWERVRLPFATALFIFRCSDYITEACNIDVQDTTCIPCNFARLVNNIAMHNGPKTTNITKQEKYFIFRDFQSRTSIKSGLTINLFSLFNMYRNTFTIISPH